MVEICMGQDRKDHFYEGMLYHFLVDPLLRRVRRLVRSQVKPGSTLIDIGCGTGELLFSLADVGSELVGVETSNRMWSFANRQARRRGFNNVQILLGDGARLENFSAGFFDYAIEVIIDTFKNRNQARGLKITREPPFLCTSLPDLPNPARLDGGRQVATEQIV